ncbi:hypothetical protein F4820DRAFT_426577 [Hypoxylon rubiginosum]|uniref:Uncharacterized protein n=1 Tax=Hypoxylon rubiginosum TaxID=110542 RepID=A0ACB9YWC1_9PEZI|nr:hypothetical protein F4820DRAFT_426577 [Hypoxylon rubiginosum]
MILSHFACWLPVWYHGLVRIWCVLGRGAYVSLSLLPRLRQSCIAPRLQFSGAWRIENRSAIVRRYLYQDLHLWLEDICRSS